MNACVSGSGDGSEAASGEDVAVVDASARSAGEDGGGAEIAALSGRATERLCTIVLKKQLRPSARSSTAAVDARVAQIQQPDTATISSDPPAGDTHWYSSTGSSLARP